MIRRALLGVVLASVLLGAGAFSAWADDPTAPSIPPASEMPSSGPTYVITPGTGGSTLPAPSDPEEVKKAEEADRRRHSGHSAAPVASPTASPTASQTASQTASPGASPDAFPASSPAAPVPSVSPASPGTVELTEQTRDWPAWQLAGLAVAALLLGGVGARRLVLRLRGPSSAA